MRADTVLRKILFAYLSYVEITVFTKEIQFSCYVHYVTEMALWKGLASVLFHTAMRHAYICMFRQLVRMFRSSASYDS
jgi:hypothetical protein